MIVLTTENPLSCVATRIINEQLHHVHYSHLMPYFFLNLIFLCAFVLRESGATQRESVSRSQTVKTSPMSHALSSPSSSVVDIIWRPVNNDFHTVRRRDRT